MIRTSYNNCNIELLNFSERKPCSTVGTVIKVGKKGEEKAFSLYFSNSKVRQGAGSDFKERRVGSLIEVQGPKYDWCYGALIVCCFKTQQAP